MQDSWSDGGSGRGGQGRGGEGGGEPIGWPLRRLPRTCPRTSEHDDVRAEGGTDVALDGLEWAA